MNILLIIICATLFVFSGQPEWLASGSLLLRMTAYHFYHASIFHLAVNSIAAYSIFGCKRKDNLRCLIVGYIIACAVYPLSPVPCIGMSNILYAVIGMRTPPFANRWWLSVPVLTFLAVTFAMLFVPGIAALTHIVSLAIGIVASHFIRIWKR